MRYETVSQNEKFVRPEHIRQELMKVIPGCAITEGGFTSRSAGTLVDQQWNHMDQGHRETIHNAYHGAMRITTGRDFAFSITRWGNWPVFIPVADLRITKTMSYQVFSVFGLVLCHQQSDSTELEDGVELRVRWHLASHWLLKPLRLLVNRMLLKVHKKQYGEDVPIRNRRHELRKKGVTFETDVPDYINSNDMGDHVLFPAGPFTAPLGNLVEGKKTEIHVGPVQILVERQGSEIRAWPMVCPHEGALMGEEHLCEGRMKCPWHSRTFPSVVLDQAGQKSLRASNGFVRRRGESLEFSLQRDNRSVDLQN